MKNNPIRLEIEGALNPTTGAISLGGKQEAIQPTLDDFRIPKNEPTRTSPRDVNDIAHKVQQQLWAVTQAEEGLESLKMADFLRNLSDADRASLYNDLSLDKINFSWLLCVRPSAEDAVIAQITSMLAEPNKHCPDFYRKRTAFENFLDASIGDRYQNRNNARWVRANPRNAPATEAYYRKRLLQE